MTADQPSTAALDDLAGVVDLFGWLTREELTRALSELAFKQRTAVDDDAISAAIDRAVAEYVLVPAPLTALSAGGEPVADGETRATDSEADSAPAVTGPSDGIEADTVAFAVGPAAFPSLPRNAGDLPHILDLTERSVDRDRLVDAVVARFRSDAASAVAATDVARIETLVDVTYDIETWASADVDDLRTQLAAELDD